MTMGIYLICDLLFAKGGGQKREKGKKVLFFKTFFCDCMTSLSWFKYS
jgi:hypothetical protein